MKSQDDPGKRVALRRGPDDPGTPVVPRRGPDDPGTPVVPRRGPDDPGTPVVLRRGPDGQTRVVGPHFEVDEPWCNYRRRCGATYGRRTADQRRTLGVNTLSHGLPNDPGDRKRDAPCARACHRWADQNQIARNSSGPPNAAHPTAVPPGCAHRAADRRAMGGDRIRRPRRADLPGHSADDHRPQVDGPTRPGNLSAPRGHTTGGHLAPAHDQNHHGIHPAQVARTADDHHAHGRTSDDHPGPAHGQNQHGLRLVRDRTTVDR